MAFYKQATNPTPESPPAAGPRSPTPAAPANAPALGTSDGCQHGKTCINDDDCGGLAGSCVDSDYRQDRDGRWVGRVKGKCDCGRSGSDCQSNADCEPGYECKDVGGGRRGCVQVQRNDCRYGGCPPGQVCVAKGGGAVGQYECVNEDKPIINCGQRDSNGNIVKCKPPLVCVEGKCVPPEEETKDCPKGNIYNSLDGKCDKGYKFVKRPNNGNPKDWAVEIKPVPGAVGTCECESWITKPEKGLGEFQWPSELTDLYNRLMGRAGEYLSRKPGYSQTALDTAYGKGYENIRNLGKSTTDQTIANLQREGMLGTGAGQEALRKIPWQTEKGVSDVIRDVFLGNEEQKRKDLESYTRIAQNLFGTGTNFKTILESINAARRGEGQNALAMMMSYITSLMNSWKS